MNISLPSLFKITPAKDKPFSAQVDISPLYPGYGHSIGNFLRRVLLSSLEGAAITSIKIEGANHEFMTLPHIKEEVLEIILNLKQLNLKLHTDGPEKLSLEVKGKKKITAVSFKKNPNVEIMNAEQHIADLTHKDAQLVLEVTVEKGLGFSKVEDREKRTELGVIAIDAVFSPIKSIGYVIEDVRVGKRTDYDKLLLDIETNGTVSVAQAVKESAQIAVEQFNFILEQALGNGGQAEKLKDEGREKQENKKIKKSKNRKTKK
ncbi:MAG: DNA-directed RNA polymerase subunit alpha [Patescibacteria group bacterium]